MARTRTTRSSAVNVTDLGASKSTAAKTSSKKKGTNTKKAASQPPPSPRPSPESSDSDSDSDDEAVVSAINLAASAVKKKLAPTSQCAGNELTFLIPGYTAPMSLTSDTRTPDLYIKYDKKEANPSTGDVASLTGTNISSLSSISSVMPPPTSHIMKGSIKKKKKEKTTAGEGWFDMPSYMASSNMASYRQQRNAEMLKDDLKVIKMRNYLDPKKFYKSSDDFR